MIEGVDVVLDMFDYCFAENGLTAFKHGQRLPAEVALG
jgi:Eukaryotic phosphomannomutase